MDFVCEKILKGKQNNSNQNKQTQCASVRVWSSQTSEKWEKEKKKISNKEYSEVLGSLKRG